MRSIDHLFEKSSRALAQRTSRRSLLAVLGQVLTGCRADPVAAHRSLRPRGRSAGAPRRPKRPSPRRDDPKSCDYWKYCAVDGFLCACCGGSSNSCPPGTTPSPITWIGTCHNPGDGRDYIVSYNDCCGKVSCGNCECNRNEREKPMYRPSRNNDLNWCMANADSNYHCSVSVISGRRREMSRSRCVGGRTRRSRGHRGRRARRTLAEPRRRPGRAAAMPRAAATFQANCAVCHGAKGLGQPSLAPPLTSYPARYASIAEGRRQLAMTVLNGMFGGIDVDVETLRFQNAGLLAAR